jgi:hypothetical protein
MTKQLCGAQYIKLSFFTGLVIAVSSGPHRVSNLSPLSGIPPYRLFEDADRSNPRNVVISITLKFQT